MKYKEYSSLYIPDYMIQVYEKEILSGIALQAYGWNDYDEEIKCPDEVRLSVLNELENMEPKLFYADINYFQRCREQFKKAYECRPVPYYEYSPALPKTDDNRNVGHLLVF